MSDIYKNTTACCDTTVSSMPPMIPEETEKSPLEDVAYKEDSANRVVKQQPHEQLPEDVRKMQETARQVARNQQNDILARDKDVPLPDFFKGQYGAAPDQLPDRLAVKRTLMHAMADQYPNLDFVMRLALVEHYLSKPTDTPESLIERAPKRYFDERNVKVHPPQGGASSSSPEEEGQDGFLVEGPPGGRGQITGDNDDSRTEEEEEEGEEESERE